MISEEHDKALGDGVEALPDGAHAGARDPLYLFACHLEWREKETLAAYKELLAALDDPDEHTRAVAEALLKRRSPRPRADRASIDAW